MTGALSSQQIQEKVRRNEAAFAASKSPQVLEAERKARQERYQKREAAKAQARAAQQTQQQANPEHLAPPNAASSNPPLEAAPAEQVEASPQEAGGEEEPEPPSPPARFVDQDEPWGKLETVKCPLEGYEGFTVTYRVNNKYGVTKLRPSPGSVPEDTFVAAFFTWLSRFVKAVSLPPPYHRKLNMADPAAYDWLFETMNDFYLWLSGEGYVAAKEQALGPSFQGDAGAGTTGDSGL